MSENKPLSLKFQLSLAAPCPYLPDRDERKIFSHVGLGVAPQLFDKISEMGFRRNQSIIYRPQCDKCGSCQSARVIVDEFTPSKSQKRVLAKNKNIQRFATVNMATIEQYELFKLYQNNRHAAGDMSNMNGLDYTLMLEDSPVETMILEYRENDAKNLGEGKLIGAMILDQFAYSLSLVYSFFDPEYERQSMGTHMILDAVHYAKQHDLQYVYLGYWVKGSKTMDYKSRFKPLEVFNGQRWNRIEQSPTIKNEAF